MSQGERILSPVQKLLGVLVQLQRLVVAVKMVIEPSQIGFQFRQQLRLMSSFKHGLDSRGDVERLFVPTQIDQNAEFCSSNPGCLQYLTLLGINLFSPLILPERVAISSQTPQGHPLSMAR
jgi:hypothetical protein